MKNRTILISGGLGLLGKQFARTLSEMQATVVVLDTSEQVRKQYMSSIDRYLAVSCDITNENQVMDVLQSIHNRLGHIDILINCAAYNEQPSGYIDNSFENYSLDKWNRTLAVNLTGAFLLSRECIKYMLRNENEGFKGTIINIISDLSVIAPDHSIYENEYKKPVDYCVSKAGLLHLTKYIAGYYRDIIKSVALIPGSVYNGQSEVLKKNLEDRTPIGRLARKEEFNGAIKFLCSSDSDHMQGQSLIMDGGRTIW